MADNSTWNNAYRILKERKPNIYSEISNETGNQIGIPSNSITQGHNDPRDAFRHAYTSAIVADRYGETVSKVAGNANEMKNHLPGGKVIPEEEWMDYYNNKKGREIAEQVKARGGNEDDIKREVAKAISNNELVLTPFDPRRTYEEHGDFERAVKESEQQMETSWNREMADISNDADMSAAEKQEARRKLDEKYQEYERQFNQVIERERNKNSR